MASLAPPERPYDWELDQEPESDDRITIGEFVALMFVGAAFLLVCLVSYTTAG